MTQMCIGVYIEKQIPSINPNSQMEMEVCCCWWLVSNLFSPRLCFMQNKLDMSSQTLQAKIMTKYITTEFFYVFCGRFEPFNKKETVVKAK